MKFLIEIYLLSKSALRFTLSVFDIDLARALQRSYLPGAMPEPRTPSGVIDPSRINELASMPAWSKEQAIVPAWIQILANLPAPQPWPEAFGEFLDGIDIAVREWLE